MGNGVISAEGILFLRGNRSLIQLAAREKIQLSWREMWWNSGVGIDAASQPL